MAHAECITVERNGPVTTIVIDRPQARNACSVDMIRALHTAFAEFERDPDRPVSLVGATVGIISNGKANTRPFFAHLARLLREE